MKYDKYDLAVIGIVCMIVGFVLGATIIIITEIPTATQDGYKSGFIDAKIGKDTYILETQPDSTRIWIKK